MWLFKLFIVNLVNWSIKIIFNDKFEKILEMYGCCNFQLSLLVIDLISCGSNEIFIVLKPEITKNRPSRGTQSLAYWRVATAFSPRLPKIRFAKPHPRETTPATCCPRRQMRSTRGRMPRASAVGCVRSARVDIRTSGFIHSLPFAVRVRTPAQGHAQWRKNRTWRSLSSNLVRQMPCFSSGDKNIRSSRRVSF